MYTIGEWNAVFNHIITLLTVSSTVVYCTLDDKMKLFNSHARKAIIGISIILEEFVYAKQKHIISL